MLRLPEQQNQLSVIMLLSKPLASSWAPLLGSCVVPGPTLARVSTAEGCLSRGASFLNAVPYRSCPEEGCMVMKADLFSGGAGCQTWRKARTRNQQSVLAEAAGQPSGPRSLLQPTVALVYAPVGWPRVCRCCSGQPSGSWLITDLWLYPRSLTHTRERSEPLRSGRGAVVCLRLACRMRQEIFPRATCASLCIRG